MICSSKQSNLTEGNGMTRNRWTQFLLSGVLAGALAGCAEPGDAHESQVAQQPRALAPSALIIITPSMVHLDTVRPAKGNYDALFDEQTVMGDPRAGTTYKPATEWATPTWVGTDYPMGFYVDLGQEYDVTEVGVFDTFNSDTAYFDVGSPGAWTSVVTFPTNLYERWQLFPITSRTRYVRFSRNMFASVNEIVIYGAPVDGQPPPNQAPTVSAGTDQTVTLPTASATLSGTASDADGTIASSQWMQLTGPNTATLANATSLTATVSGLVTGVYEFQLTVTDDDGASASSKTKVTVNPASNGRGTTTEVYRSSSTPGGFGHVVYLPPGYEAGSNWPIVFFLHGVGQRGDGGPTQLLRVREQGPQRLIDQEGKDFPFILVSPQTGPNGQWSAYEMQYYLDPFIEFILAKYKTDRKRVYLTGLSLGGSGTWDYATIFPTKLAAILPVCGGSWGANATDASEMIAAGLAIWSAHAKDDGTILYTATASWFTELGKAMGGTGGVLDTYTSPQAWQTAFFRPATGKWEWINGQTATDSTGAGPAKPVLFTLYHDGDHYIWDHIYKDPQVWNWLLAQHRP